MNHMPRWSHDGMWVYFFQLTPHLSFRRVPAVGGASEAVLPMKWEEQNFPQFDPTGRLMAYTSSESQGPVSISTSQETGKGVRTMIRDMTANTEHALPGPGLHMPRWSRDGTSLLGSRDDGTIAVCAVDGSGCRTVTRGGYAAWSGDGSQIYFLRNPAAGASGERELWSVNADGTAPRMIRRIGPFRLIDTFIDVSPQNQIVWTKYQAGRRELWAATVH